MYLIIIYIYILITQSNINVMDTKSFTLLAGLVSLITLIVFIVMASNISSMKREIHQMRNVLKQYAIRDGIVDNDGRIISQKKE